MTNNTRYNKGDKVTDRSHEGIQKGEVQYIQNPDSDSPTYVIDENGYKYERKASDIRKHGQDWAETAQQELEDRLEVATEKKDHYHLQIANAGENAISLIGESKGTNGEREWTVFKNLSAARRAAVEEVRRNLEEMPESFNQDFLEDYLYVGSTDRRMIAQDDAESRLVGASLEELKDMAFSKDVDIPESDDPAVVEEKLQENLRVKLKSELEQQIQEDPESYFRPIYGVDWVEQSFIKIDKEEAAEAAVDEDGIGHFLDHYDGRAVELPSGALAYGVN